MKIRAWSSEISCEFQDFPNDPRIKGRKLEGPDQTEQMHRLVWAFNVHISHSDHFSVLRYMYFITVRDAVTNESHLILCCCYSQVCKCTFDDVIAIFS